MNDKNLPLYLLVAVGIVGLIATLGMFAAISAGLFNSYDFETGTSAGPSVALALIPLGIAVVAGVGALVLWGQRRQRD